MIVIFYKVIIALFASLGLDAITFCFLHGLLSFFYVLATLWFVECWAQSL
jgi:hypothetical protein